MVMVAFINCCLPSIISHQHHGHFEIADSQSCHSDEKQDLDLVASSHLVSNEDVKADNVSKFRIRPKVSFDCSNYLALVNKSYDGHLYSKLWGYNSAEASGVFRL